MNKLLQASLVATLMSAGSTALYAEDDTASRPSYNWGNCTSLGCEKDIPIKLEIPKKCEVLGGSAITLSKDGGPKLQAILCVVIPTIRLTFKQRMLELQILLL